MTSIEGGRKKGKYVGRRDERPEACHALRRNSTELLRSQVSMRMERIVSKGEAYRLIYLRQGWEAFFHLSRASDPQGIKQAGVFQK